MNPFPALCRPARLLAIAWLIFGLWVGSAAAQTPLGTAFTYQGRLTDGASPANGAYDFEFQLFTLASGGTGSTTQTLGDVTVASGLFTVKLDFGAEFTGSPRWLEIRVRPGVSVGAYTALASRQELTPSPNAVYAAKAGEAATAVGVSGPIAGSQITGPIAGEVPPGYMILGSSTNAPAGFALVGPLGSYYLFIRQGAAPPGVLAVLVSTPSLSVNEGGTATFTVSLYSAPDAPLAPVTVAVGSSNIGVATLSPASLTFTPANFATPQTVTVTGVQDSNVVNNIATAILTAAGALSASVALTEVDDDIQAIIVSATTVNLSEGGTTAFTAKLAFAPATGETIVVAVTSSDPGAALAYAQAPPIQFNEANYETPQTVIVQGVQDADVLSETVSLYLTSAGVTTRVVRAQVTDDDTQAILLSVVSLTVNENGTASFTVQLSQDPSGSLSVTVASGNTLAATVSPTTLAFTSGNYLTPQTVTVSGVADANALSEIVTITLSASGVFSSTIEVTTIDTGP